MNVKGLPALFFIVPFFVGAFVCGLSGIAAGLYVVASICDWITDKLVRQFDLYDAVVAAGRARIKERRERHEPYKSSRVDLRRRPKADRFHKRGVRRRPWVMVAAKLGRVPR